MLLTTYNLTRNITYKQKTMVSFPSKSTIYILNKTQGEKKKYCVFSFLMDEKEKQ